MFANESMLLELYDLSLLIMNCRSEAIIDFPDVAASCLGSSGTAFTPLGGRGHVNISLETEQAADHVTRQYSCSSTVDNSLPLGSFDVNDADNESALLRNHSWSQIVRELYDITSHSRGASPCSDTDQSSPKIRGSLCYESYSSSDDIVGFDAAIRGAYDWNAVGLFRLGTEECGTDNNTTQGTHIEGHSSSKRKRSVTMDSSGGEGSAAKTSRMPKTPVPGARDNVAATRTVSIAHRSSPRVVEYRCSLCSEFYKVCDIATF